MRNAIRWGCAVLAYAIVLLGATIVVMTLAWGCHHRPIGSGGFACSDTFRRYGFAIMLTVIIVGHSLASAVAVALAPAYRRIVGAAAVLIPVVFLSLAMRNTVTGEYDFYNDVIPILLTGIPTAICTFLVIRELERRHVA